MASVSGTRQTQNWPLPWTPSASGSPPSNTNSNKLRTALAWRLRKQGQRQKGRLGGGGRLWSWLNWHASKRCALMMCHTSIKKKAAHKFVSATPPRARSYFCASLTASHCTHGQAVQCGEIRNDEGTVVVMLLFFFSVMTVKPFGNLRDALHASVRSTLGTSLASQHKLLSVLLLPNPRRPAIVLGVARSRQTRSEPAKLLARRLKGSLARGKCHRR